MRFPLRIWGMVHRDVGLSEAEVYYWHHGNVVVGVGACAEKSKARRCFTTGINRDTKVSRLIFNRLGNLRRLSRLVRQLSAAIYHYGRGTTNMSAPVHSPRMSLGIVYYYAGHIACQ